jgi:hypothetical protein
MKNTSDVDHLGAEPVNDDIRQRRHHELARAGLLTDSPAIWKPRESRSGVVDPFQNPRGILGRFIEQAIRNALEVYSRFSGPPKIHLACALLLRNEFFQAPADLLVLNHLARIHLC